MRILALATTSVALSVAAQFVLKAGDAAPAARGAAAGTAWLSLAALGHPFVIAGLAMYGLGALIWLHVLAHWDVSKAYPLVGAGLAATVVLGMYGGEAVSPSRAVGVMLICAGVWLVARS